MFSDKINDYIVTAIVGLIGGGIFYTTKVYFQLETDMKALKNTSTKLEKKINILITHIQKDPNEKLNSNDFMNLISKSNIKTMDTNDSIEVHSIENWALKEDLNNSFIDKSEKTKISKQLRVKELNQQKSSEKKIKPLNYDDFTKSISLSKNDKIYTDSKLIKEASPKNTKLYVDISNNRIKLLVNDVVALDSPVKPNTMIYSDKLTPNGTFKITQKIVNKRSTLFGKFYRNGKVVFIGDRRKYKGPKAKYEGALLQNWMRLTSSGIGLHSSKYVKGYPDTNGSIRLPYTVSKTIFKTVTEGTKVTIINSKI